MICGVVATTANAHDVAELNAILPGSAWDAYGDSAYQGSTPEGTIRAKDDRRRIVHTGTWGGADAITRLQAYNKEVRWVRARIEKVLGTCKRNYGLRRSCRLLGAALRDPCPNFTRCTATSPARGTARAKISAKLLVLPQAQPRYLKSKPLNPSAYRPHQIL